MLQVRRMRIALLIIINSVTIADNSGVIFFRSTCITCFLFFTNSLTDTNQNLSFFGCDRRNIHLYKSNKKESMEVLDRMAPPLKRRRRSSDTRRSNQMPLQPVAPEERQPDQVICGLGTSAVMRFPPGDEERLVSVTDLLFVRHIDGGRYGYVKEYRHVPSDYALAVKLIRITDDDERQKRLLADLELNKNISDEQKHGTCPYLVHSFGALRAEGDLWICMELMDTCLAKFYTKMFKLGETFPEKVIAYIAYAIVCGLQFLKSPLDIMHRDVKPSNILLSRNGDVKLCDFGISAKLIHSLARTVIGCDLYMAPERISPVDGNGYDIRSDVWSVGVTLVEIATGKQPYACNIASPLFGVISKIVDDPPPKIPDGSQYSEDFRQFIVSCCKKNVAERPRYAALLETPFLTRDRISAATVGAFVTDILDAAIPESS